MTFSVGAINSGTNGTGIYAPPPTFNFEDLGLVVKVTPHVHGTDEVTLEVSSEFKLLEAASVDGIPVISNKKYESKVRLARGEWAVLAGLMTASDARTITGIPGLSLIPFLRNNTVNNRYRPNVARPQAAHHHPAPHRISHAESLDRD